MFYERYIKWNTFFTSLNGERIIIIPRANPVNAFTIGGIIKDAGFSIQQIKDLL